jgi:hypothetical protein
MKNIETPKIKRPMKSFECDDDVFEMLQAAQDAGLSLKEIANRALRKYGPKVVTELATEARSRLLPKSRGGRLSFNSAPKQSLELSLAA